MLLNKISVIVLIVSIACVYAQVPFFGSCPHLETMPDFNPEAYLGKWYEAERYFAFFEFAGKCVFANYTETDDNSTVNVYNQQINSLTGFKSSINGVATINTEDTSKLSVQFNNIGIPIISPYWVLDTDYDNYAVVWSCSNFGFETSTFFSTRNAWILTRARYPTLEIMQKAYNVIDKNGISRAYFIRTDQKNCAEDH